MTVRTSYEQSKRLAEAQAKRLEHFEKRYLPCPDCRDKVNVEYQGCYRCENQRLKERLQEMDKFFVLGHVCANRERVKFKEEPSLTCSQCPNGINVYVERERLKYLQKILARLAKGEQG